MTMLVSSLLPTAVAASQEAVEEQKQLYSTTVDLADLMATGGFKYKSVDLSRILGGYSSDWSSGCGCKFFNHFG